MKTVLFFINPFLGHINANLSLAKNMQEQSIRVLFFSTDRYREKIEKAGLTWVEYPSSATMFDWKTEKKLSTIEEGIEKVVRYYSRHFSSDYKLFEDFAERMINKYNADAIIYDYADAYWAKQAAIHCCIPYISSSPTFAINRNLYDRCPEDFIKYVWRIPYDRSFFKNERYIDKFANLIEKKIRRENHTEDFDIFEIGNSPYLNIIHTAKEYQKHYECFDATFRFIGYQYERNQGFSDFPFSEIENREVIYISLGSTDMSNDPEFFRLCMHAFQDMDQLVVISTGPHIDAGVLSSSSSSFSGIVRNFCPQIKILEKARLFISHGGYNSSAEAFLLGVPMICVPYQSDQFYIAEYVQSIQAGIYLERSQLTCEKLKASAREILNCSSYGEHSKAFGSLLKRNAGEEENIIKEIWQIIENKKERI